MMEKQDKDQMQEIDVTLAFNTIEETPTIKGNEGFSIDFSSLPERFRSIVDQYSKANNISRETMLFPLLTVAGTALGANIRMKAGNYENTPCLWTMLLGASSANKSSIMRTAIKPLQKINSDLMEATRLEMAEYNRKKAQAKKGEELTRPRKKQVICNDITGAAFVELLDNNERGLMQYFDEGIEFFGNLNRYGGTSEMQTLCKCFDNTTFPFNRKGDESGGRDIRNPFASFLGGIQPMTLPKYVGKSTYLEDGSMARFIPVCFTKQKNTHAELSEYIKDEWQRLVENLYQMGNVYRMYECTEEAKHLFNQAHDRWDADADKELEGYSIEYNEYRKTVLGKTSYHVLRIALIIHCIKESLSHGGAYTNPIDAETMLWAISVQPFIVENQMQTFGYIVGNIEREPMKPGELIRAIKRFLDSQGKELNQSALATALGMAQPNISRALKAMK